MSTMEIELNNMNNTSDGTVMMGEESESKGFTGLDELLEQELKADDSVGCFIKRVGDVSEDGSEFGLNYAEVSDPSSSTFYSPKEDTSADNDILEKELQKVLGKGAESEPVTGNEDPEEVIEETTTEVPVISTVVVDEIVTEEIIDEVTEEVIDEVTDQGEEMLNETGLDDVQDQDQDECDELVQNEEENGELPQNEEGANYVQNENDDSQENEDEIVDSIQNEDENYDYLENEDEILDSAQNEDENVDSVQNEDVVDSEQHDDIVVSVQNEDENVESVQNEDENFESVQNEDEHDDSLENEHVIVDCVQTDENADSLVNEGEIVDSVQNEDENHDSTQDQDEFVDLENPDENRMITEETEIELNNDDNREKNTVEDTAMETEVDDEVQDSGEVNLPLETSNSDATQTENDTMDTDKQSEEAKNITEPAKDVIYLVFQPKETDKVTNAGKENESTQVQCSETSTTSNTNTDKSLTKAVFTIGSSSEPKTGKEMNKSIIVKKVTAKIIKNTTTPTPKPATVCDDNEDTKDKKSLGSIESEPKERREEPGNIKEVTQEEPDEATSVKITIPQAIVTKNVHESRKSPRKLQEREVQNTKEDITKNTQEQKTNVNQDKDAKLNSGVKRLVMTKVYFDKGRIGTAETDIIGENTEKKITFGAIKRKFEEICRVSREEEDAAVEEIKKMKKETVDVLKKINAEMEKLKVVFLAKK